MTTNCQQLLRWTPQGRHEARMPLDLRRALTELPRDSLNHLCTVRHIRGGTTNVDKRNALARSYRGDLRQCLVDLRRCDLLRIIQAVRQGTQGLGSRTKDELVGLLLTRSPVPTPRPSPAVLWPGEDPEEEDFDGDLDALADDDEVDGLLVEEDEPEPVSNRGARSADPALLSGLGERWSRPRSLVRLMAQLGMPPVTRLGDARFRLVLDRLDVLGIELQLPDGTVATPNSTSPGMEGRIRLRRVRPEPMLPRALPPPSLPPVVIVPSSPTAVRTSMPAHSSAESHYELAMLRLEFLTTVPSMDRQFQGEWPESFLSTAMHGLNLDMRAARLIRLAAATFLRGGHNPSCSVAKLCRCTPPGEWEWLLGEYQRLNPHLPDFVQAVVQSVRQQLNQRTGSAAPPRGSDGVPSTAAGDASVVEHASNTRPLGALHGIFQE